MAGILISYDRVFISFLRQSQWQSFYKYLFLLVQSFYHLIIFIQTGLLMGFYYLKVK
jgi:hypothetical protein